MLIQFNTSLSGWETWEKHFKSVNIVNGDVLEVESLTGGDTEFDPRYTITLLDGMKIEGIAKWAVSEFRVDETIRLYEGDGATTFSTAIYVSKERGWAKTAVMGTFEGPGNPGNSKYLAAIRAAKDMLSQLASVYVYERDHKKPLTCDITSESFAAIWRATIWKAMERFSKEDK